MSLTYKTISFTLTDSIGHLVLDQPPSNRMTLDFFHELGILVDEIRGMNEIRALVISGRGRHFSAGADLEQMLSLVKDGHPGDENWPHVSLSAFLDKNYRTFLLLESLEIPVISAIRGVCLGSAFELALFSHFRFCGEDAVFGLPETTYNLVPGIGGTSRIAVLCGKVKAMELVLRGNTFPAEVALQHKLVDRILPKKKVVEMAIGFAGTITTNYRKEKAGLYLQKLTVPDFHE